MWADVLLGAEQAHVVRLVLWAACSIVAGTAVVAWLRVRRRQAPGPFHFAVQTAAWGAVNLVIALVANSSIELRDFSSARRLERFLWLNVGLDAGYVAVGCTLALTGWLVGRRAGLVGAGMGVVVQGLALLLLDLVLANQLGRML